ncbi:MAG TPA: serine/threonine-protein kinase [Ktedonobacteraceae bacterium]|nr:serine/threonine-protein kinase [Ktedonobacteraceae bacterium]
MDVKELVGVSLGTCTIERIIGQGGMGAVFLAQQSRPARTVAVKVLLPASAYDTGELRIVFERFRREANTIAKLEHKNILPVYEYEEAEVNGQRLAYLVMPYIRGGTLRERIDEMRREGRQFDLDTVGNYINQVAGALSYAHGLGIVHRDIKPGNLLFHTDGRLLLSDFGIVHLRAMPSLTMAGSFLGTAEYASPEQISGGAVDARSDIYSLGIVLFELLTGKVPFSGPTPFVVMPKHIHEPVPSVRAMRPDLSPAVEFVVKKALAKQPKDRYASASEMAADFQAAISSALSAAAGLWLPGDANPGDLTVAGTAWQSSLSAAGTIPPAQSPGAYSAGQTPLAAGQPQGINGRPQEIAPTVAAPALVGIGQSAGAMNRPPRSDEQYAPGLQQPLQLPPLPGTNGANAPAASIPAYRQGRRLYYYGVIVAGILLQLIVLALFFTPLKAGNMSPALLGLLLGFGINLLALTAMLFTGVTRSRPIRKHFYRSLIATLLAPIVSGFFISYGMPVSGKSIDVPLIAYLVLLLSNIYTVRQLGAIDAAREQIEVAPVLWRPAMIGALTGLLPLTMILIFTLIAPMELPGNGSFFARISGVLFLALIGAPTPGAMMAIWLSRNMTFPTLLRSSAIAGCLMFVGAFLLVALWGSAPGNHTLLYYHFSQPGLAAIVIAVALALIGMLRGMLDAKVYFWLKAKRN